MAQKTPAELQAEIDDLRKQLGHEKSLRTEAEQLSAAMAEASAFGGGASEEQPTGKTVEQRVCLNPWERDEKKQKFKEVKVPTYFYTVILPVGAGQSLITNGIDYFHGVTYEVDQDTLRDLKSRVARTWDHEKSIHGENANAYRKPTNIHLGR
jgi:hypothetical protein